MVVGQGPSATFGKVISQWVSYEVTTSIFHPGSFNFRLALAGVAGERIDRDEIRSRMLSTRPDTVVRLEQGEDRTLLFKGIIDRQFIGGDRNGEFIDLSGRDAGQVLQDNECRQLSISGKTLPQVAEEIVARYRGKGFPFGVLASAEANRDILTGSKKNLAAKKTIRTAKGKAPVKIGSGNTGGPPPGFVSTDTKNARPHPGETEWAFLERHAKNLGVLMYFSAEGDLIFTAPDYSQDALYHLKRYLDPSGKGAQNNILSGGRAFDTGNTATAVHIYGHASGRGEERSQVTAKATIITDRGERVQAAEAKTSSGSSKTSYGTASSQSVWPRERTIRDSHAKTKDQATKLAQRELAQRAMNFESFEYVMDDHGQDGIIYAVDTLTKLTDEVVDFSGTVHITARTIKKARSDSNATTTTLQCLPKGAIVL